MLNIGNKTFMNLQEAVGWLLENNALPYQSTANYAGGVEIAMSTLVNPSPAKVRVGSIIFFADSKVSTVVGVTSNSFIVSDQYNDLVDDIVYVSNVFINASGHLICTLSNGDTIDAGLIKQVNNFSINGSQHLIANYNDGTTTDLGAIFSGNITVSGNLTVSGGISGNAVTGNSIIENMAGYVFTPTTKANITIEYIYVGIVKNGNKITLVNFVKLTRTGTVADDYFKIGAFTIPESVGEKLYPYILSGNSVLSSKVLSCWDSESATPKEINCHIHKNSNTSLEVFAFNASQLTQNQDYYARLEATFLLSDPLNS